MSKTRLARAVVPAAVAAALAVLLLGGATAQAEDLQSKLEDKEAKLSLDLIDRSALDGRAGPCHCGRSFRIYRAGS